MEKKVEALSLKPTIPYKDERFTKIMNFIWTLQKQEEYVNFVCDSCEAQGEHLR